MTVNTVLLSAGKASFRFSGRMHTMLCVSCDFYSSVSLITYTSWKETSTFKYYSIKCSGFLPLLYLSHNAFPLYTAAEHYKRHRILIWYRKINSAFYLTHLLQLIPLDILTFILCYGTFGEKSFKKNQSNIQTLSLLFFKAKKLQLISFSVGCNRYDSHWNFISVVQALKIRDVA